MDRISDDALKALDTVALVRRMDDILASSSWQRMGNSILKLNVDSVFDSVVVQKLPPNFQRKVIYMAFRLLLQFQYTDLAVSARFFQMPDDLEQAKQLHHAAWKQWVTVSSRISFEYFMHLTYMLGTGKEFEAADSAIRDYKKWLKKPKNQYTYFAITAARARKYDRTKRTPEVHATSKLARRVLLMSAADIDLDYDLLHLHVTLKNQWQFILDIANDREPSGWVSSGNVSGDKEWYEVWESGDHDAITCEVDKWFQWAESNQHFP